MIKYSGNGLRNIIFYNYIYYLVIRKGFIVIKL